MQLCHKGVIFVDIRMWVFVKIVLFVWLYKVTQNSSDIKFSYTQTATENTRKCVILGVPPQKPSIKKN